MLQEKHPTRHKINLVAVAICFLGLLVINILFILGAPTLAIYPAIPAILAFVYILATQALFGPPIMKILSALIVCLVGASAYIILTGTNPSII